MKKFKKVISVAVAAVAALCVGMLAACSKPSSEYLKFKYLGNTNAQKEMYIVEGYYDGLMVNGDVIVPEEYEGKPVGEIIGKAFKDCPYLKSITVGDSVYYIGNYAFENCKKLKKVTLGKKIVELFIGTFKNCTALTAVDLCKVENIYQSAFENCSALKSIVFPESVKHIEMEAFKKCNNLTTLEFKNSAMYRYDGVKRGLELGAFINCPVLENITFPEGSYPLYSENNCIIDASDKSLCVGGINSVIPDDGSVERISGLSFAGRNITEITIPDSVQSISDEAFKDCPLTKIYLPENSQWVLKNEYSSKPIYINTSVESMTPENVARHMLEIYPHYNWKRI